MADLTFTKNGFNIENINSVIDNFCTSNNIHSENSFKMQLICEEFLSNILFPNFEGDVEFLINSKDSNTLMTFKYQGADFMNKINETTMLSLKILQNKAKEVNSSTENGITKVEFLV